MPKFIIETQKTKFLIAIVFVKQENFTGYDCKKYRHNIKDTTHYVSKFARDMKEKFPAAEYINFYYKSNGTFKERVYLE